ncbi:MAG: putative viral replication protein [Cressdnaviricota sp.]|nr:MAG: putative viral replication protein [Cressdnaviricota sp.]
MSRAKHWCFTLNNYNDSHVLRLSALVEDDQATYLCFGKEVGEQGTPHLQGYASFTKQVRLNQVRALIPDAHLSVARGNPEQNRTYCSKEDDFLEFGNLPGLQGQRTDLQSFMDAVKGGCTERKELLELHPSVFARYPRFVGEYISLHEEIEVPVHPLYGWQQILEDKLKDPAGDREIIFVVDTEGNTGKTYYSKLYCSAHPTAQYMEMTKKADMAYALRRDVTHLFVNCTRHQTDFLNYSFLEAVKDGMVFSGKYESGTKILGPCHVVVMMNVHPDMEKLSVDRYKIIMPN